MKKNNNGFTIIEVVLVLAIAGLIFLAVFIALPALQRGQRDNQRRSDASRFASQLQIFATNNNGTMPANNATAVGTFVNSYLRKGDEGFKDPKSGNDYVVTMASGAPENVGTFYYFRGGKCKGETIEDTGGGDRTAAIATPLEGSGVYCQDVQK